MSITLSGAPQHFAPAYNPNVFYFNSTNVAEPGFRYLVNIYSATTSTLLGQFKVAPRPIDNIGYIDTSRIITNLLSYDFNPLNTGSTKAINSYINYDIKIGEEYNTQWNFGDYEYQSGTGTTADLVQLHELTNTIPHTYIVGDQINVTTANNINGLHTVVSVPNAYKVIIDFLYTNVTPTGTISGSTVYADNRKTQFSNLYNASGYTAWNGAIPFNQFNSYEGSGYTINQHSVNTTSALTNLPVDSFYCTPEQDLWVNFGSDTTDVVSQNLKFENSNGDKFNLQYFGSIANSGNITQVSIGPNNATPTLVISGTLPLIKSDTEWYTWRTSSAVTTATTKTYKIYIDRRCKIEEYEIAFLDRKGSFLSYAFQLASKEDGNIKRESCNKQIGDLSNSKYSYNSYDKGMSNYNIEVTKKLTLNTNWMNDEMSVLFEELLTSPQTYVKIDMVYYACTIDENSFEVKRIKNKSLIRQSVTITLSNQNVINI